MSVRDRTGRDFTDEDLSSLIRGQPPSLAHASELLTPFSNRRNPTRNGRSTQARRLPKRPQRLGDANSDDSPSPKHESRDKSIIKWNLQRKRRYAATITSSPTSSSRRTANSLSRVRGTRRFAFGTSTRATQRDASSDTRKTSSASPSRPTISKSSRDRATERSNSGIHIFSFHGSRSEESLERGGVHCTYYYYFYYSVSASWSSSLACYCQVSRIFFSFL